MMCSFDKPKKERQIPDAEDAKVTQKTQKRQKRIQKEKMRVLAFFFLVFLLRNFCVLCVRLLVLKIYPSTT
ncbi:MAG: hypothetical protein EAZ37_07645 [Burkholderiales bacterium]|nr:MAG: hypothetical protein EAZ37_07645 [Burkholderiales bacterium]